ncbi:MAG: hypothetical protein ATN36_03790 [Epulopiscium sp. Nele67-Bin005]|nr:MAG: hypothetical protein ATN36_03790 [Epulopiscium sp. Nele67-Bin005]
MKFISTFIGVFLFTSFCSMNGALQAVGVRNSGDIHIFFVLIITIIIMMFRGNKEPNKESNQEDTVNNKQKYNSDMLVTAVMNGNFDSVKYLVESGANVNSKNSEGFTALMTAVMNGNFEIVQYLVENGGTIQINPNDKRTDVFEIAKSLNHNDILEYLSGFEIAKHAYVDDYTANQLIQTAVRREFKTLKETISNINPNIKNDEGETVLMTVAKYGPEDIVDYLINIGCDVNIKNNVGYTALMYASKYGNIDIVRLLVNNGADVNAENNSGFTASKVAELTRNFDIQQYLQSL